MATKPVTPKTLVLPPKLAELHSYMYGKGDISILEIYRNVIEPNDPVDRPKKPLREAQQYLGPYFTKLNRRLREHGLHVRPGRIKGTYRLAKL